MIDDFKPKAKNQNNEVDGNPYVGQVIRPQQKTLTTQDVSNNILTRPAPAGPYRPVIASSSKQNQTPQIQQLRSNQVPLNNNQVQSRQNFNNQDNIDQIEMAEQKNMLPTKKKSKLKKILLIILIILVLAGASFAAWWFGLRDTSTVTQLNVNNVNQPEETPIKDEPAKFVAALSGLELDEATSKRPVTAIMIENSEDARPQSGLIDADVVYEAIAEGGITRFIALYQSKRPDYIGPVRSARPYYVEWAKMYDAAYVHAGGSPDALQLIKSLSVRDVSAFNESDEAFYRVSSRISPHNLYSNFNGLDKINQAKNYTSSTFTPWARKVDSPQSPTVKNISITISSPVFNPSYIYDETNNSYKRSQNKEIHTDEKQNKQISPKTVLVMVMPRSQDGIYSVYNTSGNGTFIAFQDGIVSEGTWSRNGTSLYTFKDKYGLDYNFNRGQTWVSVVTNKNDVKYGL